GGGGVCCWHERLWCLRDGVQPLRSYELECDRTLQRRIDRTICDAHRAAAQFPSRFIVATLDPVVPQSICYRSEQFFVRFLRVVESDAQQANHAPTEAARKSSR